MMARDADQEVESTLREARYLKLVSNWHDPSKQEANRNSGNGSSSLRYLVLARVEHGGRDHLLGAGQRQELVLTAAPHGVIQ